MSQQPPPQDPYGQPQADPYAAQQGYSQPYYSGYAQYQRPPRQPLDIGQLLFIGAWVVLGLFTLKFFYALAQDEPPLGHDDFADRLFGGFQELGVGAFYTGVLLFLSAWLRRPQGGQ